MWMYMNDTVVLWLGTTVVVPRYNPIGLKGR